MIGRLLSLDPANLVVVGTIAFGYLLHFNFEKFPKKYIRLATAAFTLILYPLLAWKKDQPFSKLVEDVVVAMVLWVVALGVHKFILLPLREKFLKGKTEPDKGDETDTISKK